MIKHPAASIMPIRLWVAPLCQFWYMENVATTIIKCWCFEIETCYQFSKSVENSIPSSRLSDRSCPSPTGSQGVDDYLGMQSKSWTVPTVCVHCACMQKNQPLHRDRPQCNHLNSVTLQHASCPHASLKQWRSLGNCQQLELVGSKFGRSDWAKLIRLSNFEQIWTILKRFE